MQIYTKLTDLRQKYPRLVIALGMFDGVHVGHQSIIRRAVEIARAHNGTAMVFTFSNHPLSVIAPEHVPPQISNNRLREARFAALGVDVLMMIPFTKHFANHTPEEFMSLLQAYFAPKFVVTGPNYTFGAKGKGTHRLLLRSSHDFGFQTEICPAVLRDGRPVSSTRIRSLIQQGNLPEVNDFLGYPFTVIGQVIHGEARGRTLGFPTANLAIPDARVMLPNGVYASHVLYDGKTYAGLANIGDNPTFPGCNRRIEVNLLDFSGNLYDKFIEVRFLAKLRDEQKFNSVEELVTQMHKDKENARKYH